MSNFWGQFFCVSRGKKKSIKWSQNIYFLNSRDTTPRDLCIMTLHTIAFIDLCQPVFIEVNIFHSMKFVLLTQLFNIYTNKLIFTLLIKGNSFDVNIKIWVIGYVWGRNIGTLYYRVFQIMYNFGPNTYLHIYINVNFSFPRLGTQYFLGKFYRHIFTIRFEQHEFKERKVRKVFFSKYFLTPGQFLFEKFSQYSQHNMNMKLVVNVNLVLPTSRLCK